MEQAHCGKPRACCESTRACTHSFRYDCSARCVGTGCYRPSGRRRGGCARIRARTRIGRSSCTARWRGSLPSCPPRGKHHESCGCSLGCRRSGRCGYDARFARTMAIPTLNLGWTRDQQNPRRARRRRDHWQGSRKPCRLRRTMYRG